MTGTPGQVQPVAGQHDGQTGGEHVTGTGRILDGVLGGVLGERDLRVEVGQQLAALLAVRPASGSVGVWRHRPGMTPVSAAFLVAAGSAASLLAEHDVAAAGAGYRPASLIVLNFVTRWPVAGPGAGSTWPESGR